MPTASQAMLNPQDEQVPSPGMIALPITPCGSCRYRTHGFLCGTLIADKVDPAGATSQLRLIPKLEWYQTARRRQTIYRHHNLTDKVAIICDGWACVYISIPNGRRQILSFLLAGDLTSAAAVFQDYSQISVEAITDIRYCLINKADLKALLANNLDLFSAFSAVLVAKKEEVENLASDLGHKDAEQRIARLILNLMKRLSAGDLVEDGKFDFPLRHQQIADATGLTLVHVSRVIGTLRRLGIIELKDRTLTVLDRSRLERIDS